MTRVETGARRVFWHNAGRQPEHHREAAHVTAAARPSATSRDMSLGRQPIYNADREIRAYELLYRSHSAAVSAAVVDGDRASAEVMLDAVIDLGLPRISPERPVFVNFTKSLLMIDPIIPPDRCVIEVLEDVEPDSTTAAALAALKKRGYGIALDDFVYSDAMIPLIELADYVKVDVRALSMAEIAACLDRLRRFGPLIIAEKVENEQEFRACRALGCDLFQGYYLRRPEVLRGARIPSNRLSALSLLAQCRAADGSAAAVANIITRDASLTYGLLQLANSARYGRSTEIKSAAQAVSMLGIDCVFRWASLLVIAGHDNCPAGYLEMALQRARMCELAGAARRRGRPEDLYMVGLLSTLDSVFDTPIQHIIDPLPLSAEIKDAVSRRTGDAGAILDAAVAYEAGEFSRAQVHVSGDVLRKAFWAAAEYANSMLAEVRPV